MAGENAVLMSHKGVVTIEVTATADIAKGDVIAAGRNADNMPVFALADAKMGETVTCVKEAALVRIDSWENKAHIAGTHIWLDSGVIKVAGASQLKNNNAIIGVIHHDKAAREPYTYIVWRAL